MNDIPAVEASAVGDDVVILDVREDGEWRAGHIPGALHIPMGTLIERLHDVPSDQHLVAVCRGGSRSAQVTAYLLQQGRSVRNMTGGMDAWAAAGRPMVSETGAPPAIV